MPFGDLPARLAEVRGRIEAAVARGGHGQTVTIVAVTKSHGPEAPRAAWEAGLREVGENRVQEALDKMAQVDVPVTWHLIGHLQRNKVKALDQFALLHSVDSARLADVPAEAERLVGCPGLRITGVMTMAPLGADEATLRAVFGGARSARDILV